MNLAGTKKCDFFTDFISRRILKCPTRINRNGAAGGRKFCVMRCAGEKLMPPWHKVSHSHIIMQHATTRTTLLNFSCTCVMCPSEKGRLINAAAAYLLILLHSKALAQLTWYMLIKVSNITKMYIYHADTHSRSALQNSHAGARDFLSADIGNWLSRHLKIYFW